MGRGSYLASDENVWGGVTTSPSEPRVHLARMVVPSLGLQVKPG